MGGLGLSTLQCVTKMYGAEQGLQIFVQSALKTLSTSVWKLQVLRPHWVWLNLAGKTTNKITSLFTNNIIDKYFSSW